MPVPCEALLRLSAPSSQQCAVRCKASAAESLSQLVQRQRFHIELASAEMCLLHMIGLARCAPDNGAGTGAMLDGTGTMLDGTGAAPDGTGVGTLTAEGMGVGTAFNTIKL